MSELKSITPPTPVNTRDQDDVAAFRRHLEIAEMSPQRFAQTYGRRGEDTALIATEGGRLRFSDAVELILNPRGEPVGIQTIEAGFVAASANYADPDALAAGVVRSLFQSPNLNLARLMRDTVEETAVRLYAQGNARAAKAAKALGLNLPASQQIPLCAAQRVIAALIHCCIENAVPLGRRGALAVIRAAPPALRRRIIALAATTRDTTFERDTIAQIPALILFSNRLRKEAAGRRRKEILRELGLPPGTERLKFQAVGVLSHRLGLTDRTDDAKAADLVAWFSADVARALPEEAPRQKLVIDLAAMVLTAATPAHATQAAIWASNISSAFKRGRDFPEPLRRLVADYIAAPPELTAEAAIPRWRVGMSFEVACEHAEEFAAWLSARPTPGNALAPFQLPQWAPESCELPQSSMRAVRLTDAAELAAEGRRLRNCAGSYADRCASGLSVLYAIRRPANRRDDPSKTVQCPVLGRPAVTLAMLELRRGSDGRPAIAQLYEAANAPARSSIRVAVRRLLTATPASTKTPVADAAE